MRILYLSLLFFGLASPAIGQVLIKKYLQDNVHQVHSINPDDTVYDDLEYIDAAIGNARIVFLGEQDHGDANTFLAKTRMIKFLHGKKGFDVLVFESDAWAINGAWEQVNETKSAYGELRKNIYRIWSDCRQNDRLFAYIERCIQSPSTLIIAGMDCRHSLLFSKMNYLRQWHEHVTAKLPLPENTVKKLDTLIQNLLQKEFTGKPSLADEQFFYTALDDIQKQLPEDDLWRQECKSLSGWGKHAWNLDYRNASRDRQMADNLEWICEHKYPGKKIMVWAHNALLAKNVTLQVRDKGRVPFLSTTGQLMQQRYGEQVYTLGFTSFQGSAGAIGYEPYTVPAPVADCIEKWINAKGLEYGFIDFKPCTINQRFRMKGLNHELVLADWTKVFDGLFYIKGMRHCQAEQ